MEYIANDPKSKKIKKLALMLRNLDINIYIYGEKGTGKSYLANFIANGEIVENFDALNSLPKLKNRLIAVGSHKINDSLKEKFKISVEIELDPLNRRPLDTEEFIEHFKKEVQRELKIENELENLSIDLSENLNSLKRSIYSSYICQIRTKDEVIKCLENYFERHYNSEESNYNEELKLFDKAIIGALKKRYKSKVQIAKHLKINRATLSKKMEEN